MLQDDLALLNGQFASDPASRGGARGRGRGGPPPSYEPAHRRTSGIGVSPQAKASSSTYRPVDANGTLSSLLYRERPLLRPIKFVPSIYSRVLFTYEDQEAEEQAEAERKAEAEQREEEEVREMLAGELGVENPDLFNAEEYNLHAPTADRVMRVFSGSLIAPPEPLPPLPDIAAIASAAASIYEDDDPSFADGYGDEDDDEDTIEEIDFSDMGRLMASLDEAGPSKPATRKAREMGEEERFTGFYTPPIAEASTSGTGVGMDVDEAVGSTQEIQVEVERMHIDTVEGGVDTTTTTTTVTTTTTTAGTSFTAETKDPNQGAVGEDTSDALFIIDTDPTSHHPSLEKPRIPTPPPVQLGPEDDDGDEVIVYVAPHPRRAGEPTSPSTLKSSTEKGDNKVGFEPYTSVLGSSSIVAAAPTAPAASGPAASGTPAQPKRLAVHPVSTPRIAKAELAKRRKVAKRQGLLQTRSRKPLFDRTFSSGRGRRTSGFGAIGALMQERELRDEYGDGDVEGEGDERRERRRGDSDLEWGDEDDEEVEEEVGVKGQDEYMTFHELSTVQAREHRADEEQKVEVEEKAEEDNNGEEPFTPHKPSPASLRRDRKRRNNNLRKSTKCTSSSSILSSVLRNEALESAMDMDIDPELNTESDMEAMKKFARGMLDPDASAHVTFGDLEDVERMREEDEDEDEGGDGEGSIKSQGVDSEEDSDEEDDEEEKALDKVVQLEEEVMLAEDAMSALSVNDSEDDSDSDEEEEDDEKTPRSKFTARLEKLRESSRKHKAANGGDKGKGKAKMVYDDEFDDDMDFDEDEDEDDDDEDEDLLMRNMKWAEKNDEEELVAVIQELLDENEGILKARDRKSRNRLFKAISNGDFDDYDDDDEEEEDDFYFKPAKRGKKAKRQGIPLELRDQWDKDRQAKALRKQQRQLERLTLASDPFASHKGGKKSRKAMLAASKLDPTIHVLPNRIIDISTLVQMLHKFVNDLGGKNQLSLPPTDKETRKNVHELAIAFGLKSVSKGKGEARYVSVVKTTRCGPGRVDERKVARIVRRSGGAGARGNDFTSGSRGGPGGGRGGFVPKHKEGDEDVGDDGVE
ncbi:hypothetical protein MD484_g8841, partial [Candolleomyces efflorescens]